MRYRNLELEEVILPGGKVINKIEMPDGYTDFIFFNQEINEENSHYMISGPDEKYRFRSYKIIDTVKSGNSTRLITEFSNYCDHYTDRTRDPIFEENYALCPSCDNEVNNGQKACYHCGQHLRWSKSDE